MNFLNEESKNELLEELQTTFPQVVAIGDVMVTDTAVSVRLIVETDTPHAQEHEDAALAGVVRAATGVGINPAMFDTQGGITMGTPLEIDGNRYAIQCVAETMKNTTPETSLYGMNGTETDADATAIFELAKVETITQGEILELFARCVEHERYGAIYNEKITVTVLRAGVNAPADHLTAAEERQHEQLQETIDQTGGNFPAPWRLAKQSGVRDGYRIGWWERADLPEHRLLRNEITPM